MKELKKILGESLYKEVKKKTNNQKLLLNNNKCVPRSRLNEVIEQKNVYKEDIAVLKGKLEEIKREIEKENSQSRKSYEETLMDLMKISHLLNHLIEEKLMEQRKFWKER